MRRRVSIKIEDVVTYLLVIHFLLLFNNGTKYFNLVGGFYAYVLIILLFFMFGSRWQRRNYKFQLLIGLIIVYSLFSYSIKGGSQVLAVLLFWGVLFCIVNMKICNTNFLLIERAYIFFSIFMSVILLLQHRHPYTGNDAARYGIFYSASGFYDVNFTSTLLTMPTVLLFIHIYDKRTKYTVLAAIGLLLNCLSIYLLGSRSGLVIVFGSIFAYVIISGHNNFSKKILYIFGGITLIIFCLRYLPLEIIERLISRGIIDGRSTIRFASWKLGIEAFRKNPIFGNGLYSTVEMINMNNYRGTPYTAHNTFISILAMYGIVGSIPIIIFLFTPVYLLFKRRYDLYFIILYLGLMAQLFVIEAGFSEIMLLPLIYSWSYLNSKNT